VNTIQLARLTQFDSPSLDSFRAIYLASFPPSERANVDQLVAQIERGTTLCFIAKQNDDLIGMATLLPLIETNTLLLEYLAVDARARNLGVGGALMREMIAFAQNARAESGIVLEVENENEGDADERQLRQRRIGFYERLGAHIMATPTHYRMPNLAGGDPIEMKLMWLPIRAGAPNGDALRALVREIYRTSYQLADDHSLVREWT
jgi:ribosomal protein S18 acetylase RimI-like enzyme